MILIAFYLWDNFKVGTQIVLSSKVETSVKKYHSLGNLVQFSSIAQLCLTLCDPVDCSMPGFSVHHQLPKPAQTHAHQVGHVIQPSHPLLSPSPPTFNLSQHQGLFQWVSSLHHVAKSTGDSPSTSVLPMNIQGWFPLGWTGWISLQSKGLQEDSKESSAPQLESINSSILSFLYGLTLTSIRDYWKNHSFDYMDLSWQSNVSAF